MDNCHLAYFCVVAVVFLLLLLWVIVGINFEIQKHKYYEKYRFYKSIGCKPKHIYKCGLVFPIGFKIEGGKIIDSKFYD